MYRMSKREDEHDQSFALVFLFDCITSHLNALDGQELLTLRVEVVGLGNKCHLLNDFV